MTAAPAVLNARRATLHSAATAENTFGVSPAFFFFSNLLAEEASCWTSVKVIFIAYRVLLFSILLGEKESGHPVTLEPIDNFRFTQEIPPKRESGL